MAKTIKIPTYRVLIPNSTYGRKTEPVGRSSTREEVPATLLLQLSRHIFPSEDEIIDLIQSAARDFNSLPTAEETSNQEIPLSEFMKMFPYDELKGIQDGNEEALLHLRSHCPTGSYQAGRTYIHVLNGVVPNEVLDIEESAIREKGATVYEKLINRLKIKSWCLRIRLNDKDAFPDSLELEYLLDRGVKDCDVFGVSGEYEDYQAVANQLRLLSIVLNTPADVRKIADVSESLLKSLAATTVRETATCLSAGKAMSKLSEGLVGIIAINLHSGPAKEKPRHNLHGDTFSLN